MAPKGPRGSGAVRTPIDPELLRKLNMLRGVRKAMGRPKPSHPLVDADIAHDLQVMGAPADFLKASVIEKYNATH